MNKFIVSLLSVALMSGICLSQDPQKPQQVESEDIVRITSELVQLDAVVTDKKEQPVTDLKLSDFEVYDNGKKQDLQFMEFVSLDAPGRSEGSASVVKVANGVDTSVARDLSARDVRRVIAFVVDDVTIAKEDLAQVRKMLSDFVDTKMGEGDLVAIIRTFGGKGLLEQFTNDKQILRRAIELIAPRSIPPYLALTSNETGRVTGAPAPAGDVSTSSSAGPAATHGTELVNTTGDFDAPNEGANQVMKGILALSVSNEVVNSLREVPGRKSLVLVSGGLPLNELTRTGTFIADIEPFFRRLTDNATRSGVVVNTLDVRGLGAQRGVAKFSETEGKSALGMTLNTGSGQTSVGGGDAASNIGGGRSDTLVGGTDTTGQLGLSALAGGTGGVSVVNTNNFAAGLDRVLARSRAYYRLAYHPSQPFDNKFHRYEIRVHRPGVHVYNAQGYFAREDKASVASTKEEEVIRAARSPLARRDLDLAADLQYRLTPGSQAQLDVNLVVDAHGLNFTRTQEGRYHTSFDVAGFVLDQVGRTRGGISQTVNADLTEQDYRRALASGIGYTASTLASPGYYQVRLVVREAATGKIGTVARYFEVPDLSAKRLTMSSLFFYGAEASGANPQPLTAARTVSRKQDLRYAAVVYNPKLDGSKPQLRAHIIVSQNNKVLFQEPDQPIDSPFNNGQIVKIGQLGLSKVLPGRYVLTLVITDPLADKNKQTVARSLDFTVVE